MKLDISKFLNQVNHGEAIAFLKGLPDNCIDSVVVDPPYEIGFMGKGWDNTGVAFSVELWIELLRVLKPGGHLLAFCGCRTYHRMACAIEDAGFEIRDQMQWIFGSGFPKSLDVSKAIDKHLGAERPTEVKMVGDINNARYAGKAESPRVERVVQIDEPQTDEAKNWDGYGTALKPANEPICVARKPLEKGLTVAQNVLKWGTGAINIDGCRIGDEVVGWGGNESNGFSGGLDTNEPGGRPVQGRFPANIIFDEEAAELLDAQTGTLKSGAMNKAYKYTNTGFSLGAPAGTTKHICEASEGGASRFFYCAKAAKSERNKGLENLGAKKRDNIREHGQAGTDNAFNRGATEVVNFHPTVKPVTLMRYLVKLVTPKGGICLDCFGGSGTTGIGCKIEGFDYIIIEREAEYVELATYRIAAWNQEEEDAISDIPKVIKLNVDEELPNQLNLFGT